MRRSVSAVRAGLVERWEQPAGRAGAAAVRAWLVGRGPRPDGLDEIDGRVDLRGLTLSGVMGDRADPAGGVRWQSLDLSYARLDGVRLFGADIDDCRFDDASLVDFRVWGAAVRRCTFRRADLRLSILGSGDWFGRETCWEDVDFARATLGRAVFAGATLRRCTFARPGKLLQLQDCRILECRFSGVLDSLLIDGRGHRHPVSPADFSADFTGAVFRNTLITGYLVDPASLPDQPDLVLVRDYPRRLAAAAAWLDGQAGSGTHAGPGSQAGTDTQVGADAQRRAAAFLRRLAVEPGDPGRQALGGNGTHGGGDTCFDLGGLRDPDLADSIQQALAHSASS